MIIVEPVTDAGNSQIGEPKAWCITTPRDAIPLRKSMVISRPDSFFISLDIQDLRISALLAADTADGNDSVPPLGCNTHADVVDEVKYPAVMPAMLLAQIIEHKLFCLQVVTL